MVLTSIGAIYLLYNKPAIINPLQKNFELFMIKEGSRRGERSEIMAIRVCLFILYFKMEIIGVLCQEIRWSSGCMDIKASGMKNMKI